ncbi:unnamed protein product [Rotaria sp. Silwood1]|nr:unnamed protein product [Rotaria sp. Silwood1]CAF3613217.1 unnamed protein product [Rotaria sp. Silwood1]CAF3624318.1 unnamed protein product [Rotaria sp. Silwood1]CAF4785107.1 unnamed protein product [Rotaria sp. Silwood1]
MGITVAGSHGPGSGLGQLYMPWAVYIDKNENVYAADTNKNRIQMWARGATSGVIVAGKNDKGKGLNQIDAGITVAGGNEKGAAANQLNSSWDVEVARYGNIYVADTDNSQFMKWALGTTEGVQLTDANAWGTDARSFKVVYSIGLDKEGNLFIIEERNH